MLVKIIPISWSTTCPEPITGWGMYHSAFTGLRLNELTRNFMLILKFLSAESQTEARPVCSPHGSNGFEGYSNSPLIHQNGTTSAESRENWTVADRTYRVWVGADSNRRLPPCEGGVITD